MFVICKKCAHRIPVAYRPKGSTNLDGVKINGNVRVGDGGISIGDGGSISIGSGGKIGFGSPKPSKFTCPKCNTTYEYSPDDINDE